MRIWHMAVASALVIGGSAAGAEQVVVQRPCTTVVQQQEPRRESRVIDCRVAGCSVTCTHPAISESGARRVVMTVYPSGVTEFMLDMGVSGSRTLVLPQAGSCVVDGGR